MKGPEHFELFFVHCAHLCMAARKPSSKVKNTFIDVADEESPDSMTSFHDGAKTCTARMSDTASPARFYLGPEPHDAWALTHFSLVHILS